MMLSNENLTLEFLDIVDRFYPSAGPVLRCCYVKILECYLERLGKRCYYLGIYYPEWLRDKLEAHNDAFKDIAENLGLVQVVFINASRLIRDPMSRLKRDNPRLWLELYWIASGPH